MNTKETVKRIVDILPDDTTLDDVIHALYVKTKFDNGLNEILDGRGISHQEAKRRLQNLLQEIL
jgi:hypothetical protein